jgi:hypothetical protein
MASSARIRRLAGQPRVSSVTPSLLPLLPPLSLLLLLLVDAFVVASARGGGCGGGCGVVGGGGRCRRRRTFVAGRGGVWGSRDDDDGGGGDRRSPSTFVRGGSSYGGHVDDDDDGRNDYGNDGRRRRDDDDDHGNYGLFGSMFPLVVMMAKNLPVVEGLFGGGGNDGGGGGKRRERPRYDEGTTRTRGTKGTRTADTRQIKKIKMSFIDLRSRRYPMGGFLRRLFCYIIHVFDPLDSRATAARSRRAPARGIIPAPSPFESARMELATAVRLASSSAAAAIIFFMVFLSYGGNITLANEIDFRERRVGVGCFKILERAR